jgi:hypothetical protein
LAGTSGCYKTFVAVAFSCALAAGESFGSLWVPKPGKVVYVVAEGASGIIELGVTLRGEDGTEREVQAAELVSKRIIIDEPEHVELTRSSDGVVLGWRLGHTGVYSHPTPLPSRSRP